MSDQLHIKLPDAGGETSLRHTSENFSGTLPKPIETAEITISGGIATAVDCFTNRQACIETANAHFEVNYTFQTLVLTENENKAMIRKTYSGSLRTSAEIMALGIGSERKMKVDELRKLLKRFQHLFPDREKYIALMSALQNPSLSSTISSESQTDNRGSKSENHAVKAQSNNVPQGFTLCLPLFAGDMATKATVEVEILFMHENAQSPVFWLESYPLQLAQYESGTVLLDAQVSRLVALGGNVPAIVYA